jgi:hypothetical protein
MVFNHQAQKLHVRHPFLPPSRASPLRAVGASFRYTQNADEIYRLAAVNFFLFLANGTQVARYIVWSRSQSSTSLTDDIKAKGSELKLETKEIAADAKAKVESVAK